VVAEFRASVAIIVPGFPKVCPTVRKELGTQVTNQLSGFQIIFSPICT
jgi:hypothetical protein